MTQNSSTPHETAAGPAGTQTSFGFRDVAENDLRVAYALRGKTERHNAISAVKTRVSAPR